jgi:hypothetical protein
VEVAADGKVLANGSTNGYHPNGTSAAASSERQTQPV